MGIVVVIVLMGAVVAVVLKSKRDSDRDDYDNHLGSGC